MSSPERSSSSQESGATTFGFFEFEEAIFSFERDDANALESVALDDMLDFWYGFPTEENLWLLEILGMRASASSRESLR